MDLLIWLQKESSELHRSIMNIHAAVEPLLDRPLHRYYTDHSVDHSNRVIGILGGLVDVLMTSTSRLSITEVYILLAAAYLHDIGTQDELSEQGNQVEIRKRHHELTEEIVLQSVSSYERRLDLGIISIPGLLHMISLVAKGHREITLKS